MTRALRIAAAAALFACAACATSESLGWKGDGAQPFDAARDACRASAGSDERSPAFTACMTAKGWTRP